MQTYLPPRFSALVDAALHSMLIEMHSGMLTLAAVCVVATVASRMHFSTRKTSEVYGSFWPLDSFMGKLARYTEPTAYLAGIVGVVGLITSAIVGFYVWPVQMITASALGLNKIMFSIFATELWVIFIFLRAKYGENLWKDNLMAALYACVGVLGFLFMVLAGSLGAYMSGKVSVLDPIFTSLGINPVTNGVIGLATGLNFFVILIGVSLVLAVVPFTVVIFIQRRNRPLTKT